MIGENARDKEIRQLLHMPREMTIQWLSDGAGRVDSDMSVTAMDRCFAFLRESADVDMELLSELGAVWQNVRMDRLQMEGRIRELVWENAEPLITRQINNLSSDDLNGLGF